MLKEISQKILLLALACSVSGCAYMKNRGRDAYDMITISAEKGGFHASGQASALSIGAGATGGQGYGVRSGAVGSYDFSESNIIIAGTKSFVPNEFAKCRGKGYRETHWWSGSFKKTDEDDYEYVYSGLHKQKIRKRKELGHDAEEFDMTLQQGRWIHYFQLEATACLGIGGRFGINFAEIADFIVGWTTYDICKDDIAGLNDVELKKFIISQRVNDK